MVRVIHEECVSVKPEYCFERPESKWIVKDPKPCLEQVEAQTPNARPLAGGSGYSPGLKSDGQTHTQASKRPRVDKTPASGISSGITRKRAKRETAGPRSKVGEIVKAEPRVGCPYRKYDPKNNQTCSCKGKGFAEMGKIK
jgi:hypothetical protein